MSDIYFGMVYNNGSPCDGFNIQGRGHPKHTRGNMTNLALFQFNGNQVRIVIQNGDPWFVAKDLCAVLGISKYRDALSRLDDDERGSFKLDTLGGKQEMTAVSESGMYALVLSSRKPEAKPFRKWITSEVLPAIRKTGSYSIFTDHRLDPEWQVERQDGKDVRRSLTDATKAWIERNCPNMKPWEQRMLYAKHSDALNVALFGRSAKELIEYFDCNKNKLRDQFTKPEIAALKSLEWMAIRLVDIDNLHPVKAIHEAVKQCLAEGMFVDHHTEPRPLAPAKVKTKRLSKKQSPKLPPDDFVQLTWFQ